MHAVRGSAPRAPTGAPHRPRFPRHARRAPGTAPRRLPPPAPSAAAAHGHPHPPPPEPEPEPVTPTRPRIRLLMRRAAPDDQIHLTLKSLLRAIPRTDVVSWARPDEYPKRLRPPRAHRRGFSASIYTSSATGSRPCEDITEAREALCPIPDRLSHCIPTHVSGRYLINPSQKAAGGALVSVVYYPFCG